MSDDAHRGDHADEDSAAPIDDPKATPMQTPPQRETVSNGAPAHALGGVAIVTPNLVGANGALGVPSITGPRVMWPTTPTPDVEVPEGAALLGPFNGARLRDASLVLRSMNIQHMSEQARLGTYIVVFERDKRRALEALRRYEEENRDWPPQRARERLSYKGLPISALAFVALLPFSWLTGPEKFNSAWFRRGASIATDVVRGHVEQTVTALTLHADVTHVVGNVLSGAIFAHFVERRLGPGLAILAILLGGAVGNLANAAYYALVRGTQHGSIGASTAVLAAIGVLAATQLLITRENQRKRTFQDYAVPIVGGLALLGAIGASPESDLGAHGFGLLAGFLVGGALFLLFRNYRTRLSLQIGFGALASALIGASWIVALRT